jgi:hypothetical protein
LLSDRFTFKAQRSMYDRFHLVLQVNDIVDTTLLSDCECEYHQAGQLDNYSYSFRIEHIDGIDGCSK